MPRVGEESVLARPGLAITNLLYGSTEGAARALTDPTSLSPTESEDMVTRAGLDKGMLGPILRTITNPIVLIGLVLGTKYKIPTLENMEKFSDTVKKAASRFGFLSKFKGPQSIFKDHPDIYASFVDAIGQTDYFKSKYLLEGLSHVQDFEKAAGRQFGQRDQILASLVMRGYHKHDDLAFEGFKKVTNPVNREKLLAAVDAPLMNLVGNFRKSFDSMYDEMAAMPETKDKLVEALASRALSGKIRLNKKAAEAIRLAPSEAKRWQVARGLMEDSLKKGDDYLPTQVPPDFMSRDEYLQSLLSQVGGDRKAYADAVVAGIEDSVGGQFLKRKHRLLPDYRDLEKVPDILDEDGYKSVKYLLTDQKTGNPDFILPKVNLQIGEGEHTRTVPAMFRLGLLPIFETYANTAAGTYGWTLKGAGKRLNKGLEHLLRAGGPPGDKARADLLKNTYIPIAKGRLNFNQVLASQQWANLKLSAYDMLESPATKNLEGKFPSFKKMTDWTRKGLLADRGAFSLLGASSSIASWFYLSTLGANPGSAALNLLQTVMTTVPTIGPTATFKGLERVMGKSEAYFAARKAGRGHEQAISEMFEDFSSMGLISDPISDEAIRSTFKYAWDEGALKIPGRYAKGFDATKRAMMSMFSHTESLNRLIAFEGAMWKGAQEGLRGDRLKELARGVVAKTQFLSGPAHAPAGLVDKNPALRQLLHFPMKQLEFAFDTATTMGSGEQAGFMGRNWGTLGRGLAISGAAYELGKEFDIDLTAGLLTGTMPVPKEGVPFFPFPFIPPVVGVAGAFGASAITGDSSYAKRALPLLVPGGVAASRAIGFVPGGRGIAKSLGRFYADYNVQTPDGRVPVFSQDGNLVGYEKVSEIAMRAAGLPGSGGDIKKEQQGLKWLLSNRDRIRETRHKYLDAAILRGDISGAMSIRDGFEKAYGMKLQIKDSDVRAYQLRRDVPRLERVLSTMPVEMRPQFAAALQMAVFSSGGGFLGMDPAELSSGTPNSRRGARAALPSQSSGNFQRSGSYANSLSPLSNLDTDAIPSNLLPELGP